MTIKQMRILEQGAKQFGHNMGHSQFSIITKSLSEVYEENENESIDDIAEALVTAIVGSGVLEIKQHQLNDATEYFRKLAEEVKSA